MTQGSSETGLLKRLLRSRRGVLGAVVAGMGGALWPRGLLREATAAEAPAARSARAAAGTTATLRSPAWDAVPSCTASPTDRAGQGPFYIHDGERDDDVSLYREDMRGRFNADAEPGTELQLHLRVLDAATATCGATPVRDVEVYVWHCDAQGFYSGFGEPGEQQPDQVYRFRPNQNDLDNNTRFCRAVGVSNAEGVVSFRSIFPGWYNGRDIHIHVMMLKRGSQHRGRGWYRGEDHLFTTQLYFEPSLIDRVHKAAEPYLRRTTHQAYAGLILGDERGSSNLRMKADVQGGVVVAQMQLLLDPAQSRV